MVIKPVSEDQASGTTKESYIDLRRSLGSETLPLFFTYFGAFPEYLSYISEQLVNNLQDPSFNTLTVQLNKQVISQIHTILRKSENTLKWIDRYHNTLSFYTFQKDIITISGINIKLACIFIALREAIKGWAVAAKKLPKQSEYAAQKEGKSIPYEKFVFDENLVDKYENASEFSPEKTKQRDPVKNQAVVLKNKDIVKRESFEIEKNLLPEYLTLCNSDFRAYRKKEYFLYLRVQLEKEILNLIDTFPHFIFSPYNVIAKLSNKYDAFPELLYILSEQFPTLVMQRLMFSGYLMV